MVEGLECYVSAATNPVLWPAHPGAKALCQGQHASKKLSGPALAETSLGGRSVPKERVAKRLSSCIRAPTSEHKDHDKRGPREHTTGRRP